MVFALLLMFFMITWSESCFYIVKASQALVLRDILLGIENVAMDAFTLSCSDNADNWHGTTKMALDKSILLLYNKALSTAFPLRIRP